MPDPSEEEVTGAGGASVTTTSESAANMIQVMANLMQTIENNRLASEARIWDLLNRRMPEVTPVMDIFHVMPDLTKSIDDFNGEYEKGGSSEWLEVLISTAVLHSWPDEFTLQTAKAHLTGAAKNWYIANMAEVNTWDKFKQKFKKTFGVEATLTDRWTNMQKRTQMRGESISAYFHDKYKLCKALNLSIEEVKEQVIMGLSDKSIIQGILAKNYVDGDDLLHDLVSFSRITESLSKETNKQQGRSHLQRDPPNATRRQDGHKREPTCFRCGEKGHVKTDCENDKVKLCFLCRSKEHVAKDCSQRKFSVQPATRSSIQQGGNTAGSVQTAVQSTTRNVSQHSGSSAEIRNKQVLGVETKENEVETRQTDDQSEVGKYFRKVKVNDIEMSGMIDPGSSVCVIKDSIVKEREWPIKLKDIKLYGFGNVGSVSGSGVLQAKVSVDSVFLDMIDICVVPDNAQNVDIIVGRTFTDHASIAYYRVDDRLEFVWRSDFPEFPFKDIDIDGDVRIIVKADGQSIIKPESVMLIHACIDQDDVIVPVVNRTKQEMVVKDGQVVGKFKQDNIAKSETSCAEITADMIQVDENTSTDTIDRLVTLFNEYRDCFAFDISELGCTTLVKMDIRDNNVPVISKPYRASLREREVIANIVREWKANGIVTETTSQYASPVLLVAKKSGEPRLVIDYRKLNKQTEKTPFPIPSVDEQFERLSGSKIFSTLDLAHGYLQIPLTEEAKAKTAIITPDETGQFERLIFGLTNGPYEFCRLMQIVLGPLKNSVCMCYIDDLLVYRSP